MGRKYGVDLSDGLAIGGFGALEYGLAQISPTLSWIVGGLLLLVLALGPIIRYREKQ